MNEHAYRRSIFLVFLN